MRRHTSRASPIPTAPNQAKSCTRFLKGKPISGGSPKEPLNLRAGDSRACRIPAHFPLLARSLRSTSGIGGSNQTTALEKTGRWAQQRSMFKNSTRLSRKQECRIHPIILGGRGGGAILLIKDFVGGLLASDVVAGTQPVARW